MNRFVYPEGATPIDPDEAKGWDIVKCCGSGILGGDPFKFFK